MNKLFYFILLTIISITSFAQDPITERFLMYSKAKANTNLFVHFDKNVYSSNETVWFSAYIITSSNVTKHKLMSVSLISNSTNKIIFEDRFPMANGFAYGSLIIPDSIAPGQYKLLAITDHQVNKQPEVTFTQKITIISSLEPAFKASMKILETNASGSKVLVSATTADNRFLPKPTNVSYKYGNLTGTTKTDGSGQAIISLPAMQGLTDPTVYFKLKYEKDSSSLNMPIPQPKAIPMVKFYPEGGNLVTGLVNNVAWEVKNHQQKALSVKAYLYKNDKAIDSTIASNANGIGTFKLFIEDGANYTFKVTEPHLKDTIYTLPKALQKGIVLNVANAITNDTLKISLRANQAQEISLRVHNFKESFSYSKFAVQPGLRTLKIPLNQVPKGLASVTIADANERPLAERIFFAHYNNAEKISLAVDKPSYGVREKVSLKLNLKDADQKALVSIAVVQDARIEADKMTDIESYTYVSNQLSNVKNNAKGNIYNDQKYLEQLLLVKGWTRYTWTDLLNTKATDTAAKSTNLLYIGKLMKGKKAPTKNISIGAMGDESIKIVETDNKGVFDFNTPQLYSATGKKLFFFLNKSEDQSLKFSVDNELLDATKQIILNPNSYVKEIPLAVESNMDFFLKSNEKSIRLQEVTITGKASEKGLPGRNACGDFVCEFGVFNCPNHYGAPNIRQPIVGEIYKINGISRAYSGCNVTDENIFFKAEGVHLAKEFYVDSYKDPIEPAYFSTIFWKYAHVLEKGKEASIDFYTSDIAGKYRVIVQGLTEKQVVFAEKFFEVKRK